MKRWSQRLFGAGLVLGLLGAGAVTGALLVSATGIIPVKASSRHWPVTEWFLHFSMRRSIATHSLGVKKPDLSDPRLILRGATHYDIGCRSCHGSPGTRQPRIAYQMTPPPPALAGRAKEWAPEHLFTLIKHGVKFTGMPAWPAQERDDEVWAVVAFLQQLPDMDEARYLRLIGGESIESAPMQGMELSSQGMRTLLQSCIRCHGTEGTGRGSGAFPILAGQRQAYMEASLKAYAEGRRHSGIMGPIAAALKDDVMAELSAYYAGQAGNLVAPEASEAAKVERGRILAHEGDRKGRVPACVECHSVGGERTKPQYPLLAGQPADYLLAQLTLFKAELRGGTDHAHLMQEIAPRLTSQQMEDLAAYFASLPRQTPTREGPRVEPAASATGSDAR